MHPEKIKFAYFAALLLGLSGCCGKRAPIVDSPAAPVCPAAEVPGGDRRRGVFAAKTPAAATVIVVHGLNNRPSSMDAWIAALNGWGLDALRVTLTGHESDAALKHSAGAEAWVEDIRRAYCAARARFPERPVYFMGFSLGGLTGIVFAQRYPDAEISKLVLLAPAVAPTRLTIALRVLVPLRVFDLSLPSLGPEGYMVHDATPLSAFHGLLELVDEANRLRRVEALRRVPALMLASPRDSMVDFGRLKRWRDRNGLDAWRLEAVRPEPAIGSTHGHLLLDEKGMGAPEWERAKTRVRQFILGEA